MTRQMTERAGGECERGLAVILEEERLSDEILRLMEDEGIAERDLEEQMQAPPGFARQAIEGQLPVETLREVVQILTRDAGTGAAVEAIRAAPSAKAA